MASYDEVAARWVARALGRTDARPLRNDRMYEERGRLFSYGSHFELGRLIRDGRGRAHGWLLNGDTWGPTTTRHQGVTRRAVASTGLPVVIIPHSALGAAGIVRDSVRLLHVEPDRQEETRHRLAGDYSEHLIEWDEPIRKQANGAPPRTYFTQDGRFTDDANGVVAHRWWYEGEQPPAERLSHVPEGRKHPLPVECDERGWYWSTWRHWLGASLLTANVAGERSRSRWLSAFDENETRPLYFFCRLPRTSRARTYREALEDLAPRSVHAALAQGRDVKRQGDMFAIPVSLATRDVKRRALEVGKRVGVHGTDHVCTEVAVCPKGVVYARGTMRHEPAWRRPDHARLSLGKTWHLIVRNTVPAQRRPRLRQF